MPLLEKIFAIGNYNNASELAKSDYPKYDSNYEEYVLSYDEHQQKFIIQIITADMNAFHNGADAPGFIQERKQTKIAKKLEDELIAVGLSEGDYIVSANSKYISLTVSALTKLQSKINASFNDLSEPIGSKIKVSFNNWSTPIGSLLLIYRLHHLDAYTLQEILTNEELFGQILGFEFNTSIYGSKMPVFYVTNGIFDENGDLIGEVIGKRTAQLIIEALQSAFKKKFRLSNELQLIEYSETKGGPKHGIALFITSAGFNKMLELAGIGIHAKPIRPRPPRAIPAVKQIAVTSKTLTGISPDAQLAISDEAQRTGFPNTSAVSKVPAAASVNATEQIAGEEGSSSATLKDEPISAAPVFTPEFEEKLTHLQLALSLNIAEKQKLQEQINLLDEQVFNKFLNNQPPNNFPMYSEKQQLLDTVERIITVNTNLKVVTALYAYINQTEQRNILNVHAHPIRDRLTFTNNTYTFKSLLDEIRIKAYGLLLNQLGIESGTIDRRNVVSYIFKDPQYAMDIINQFIGDKIFAQHHSNYFVLNLFHDTDHVTKLESLRDDCIKHLGDKPKVQTL